MPHAQSAPHSAKDEPARNREGSAEGDAKPPAEGSTVGVLATPASSQAAEVEAREPALYLSLKSVVRVVAVLDVLVMVLSLVLAWLLRQLVPGVEEWSPDGVALSISAMPVIVLVWLLALFSKGGYAKQTFGAGPDEFRSVGQGTVMAGLVVASGSYFTHSDVSRAFLAILFLVGLLLLMAERAVVRRWIRGRRIEGRMGHSVLLVGSTAAVTRLSALLDRLPHLGYHITGCTLTDGRTPQPELPAPAVGSMSDIGATAVRLGVDTVMVAGGVAVELRDVAWALEGRKVDLVVVPHLADVAGSRMKMRPIGGLPLLHVEEPQAIRAGEWPKRVFDVVGASLLLLLALPTMLVVAALVKLGDRGPVFYRQERVGLNGARFVLWKFRSMAVDAERIDAELRAKYGHTEGIFKLHDDPRITRVGKFIRRFSLDELPQLFNVINGTMSLVGPRPHRQHEVDTYTPIARRRLAVRPGMTGLWQVSGRSDVSWEDAVRMDLYYRDNWSLIWDVGIIVKTVRAVFGRDGAY